MPRYYPCVTLLCKKGRDAYQKHTGLLTALLVGGSLAVLEAKANTTLRPSEDYYHESVRQTANWIINTYKVSDTNAPTSSPETTFSASKARAERGEAQAQFSTALFYKLGFGVAQDWAECLRYVRASAKAGYPPAQLEIYQMRAEGATNQVSHNEAIENLFAAAKSGQPAAQFMVGVEYHFGRLGTPDFEMARKWYEASLSNGYKAAACNLGIIYDRGQGVRRDPGRALDYYMIAVEGRIPLAMFNIGVSYASGEGVPLDHAEAAKWYRMAAELGHLPAQHNLAQTLRVGRGGNTNWAEAVFWYEKAATGGVSDAQVALGAFYLDGMGVTQNPARAEYWASKAASQGHAAGHAILARMYSSLAAKLDGIHKDDIVAARYARIGAEVDIDESQYLLGRHLAAGIGTRKNEVEAFMWLTLAANSGLRSARIERDALAKTLTLMQLEAGKQMAQNFKPKPVNAERMGHQVFFPDKK